MRETLVPPTNRLQAPIADLVAQCRTDWQALLQRWGASDAGRSLMRRIDERVGAGAVVFPAAVFRALECTPLSQTRVVIVGQDPYHGAGQAEGLAFSVAPGQRPPPSLANIFKELKRDLGQARPSSGSLALWAERGVLLLNSALTVEAARPASHAKLGWEALTDEIIISAARDVRPKVFMLWGAHAQSKLPLIAASGAIHAVLRCNHPSPLSALRAPAPFLGCGHFGQASRFIEARGGAFDWSLP